MANATACLLDEWDPWLTGAAEGLQLPWAVVLFTDQVCIARTEGAACEWLAQLCAGHSEGDLLEARLFGEHAELLIRWETDGKWRCRAVSDGEAPGGCAPVVLPARQEREVFLWGKRLPGSNLWFEQRIKPFEVPIDGSDAIAVADIVVYQRNSEPPVWRFKDIRTQGAV